MTVLGAILAGGRSSRFGSDKAFAMLRGKRLIDHARNAMAAQCDELVVVGREDGIPDMPRPGLGPLGGLAGAFHHAQQRGHDLVLSCSVDSVDLPDDLVALFSPAPAYMIDQPVIGLWRVADAPVLDQLLASDARHSMRAFAEIIGSRPVEFAFDVANINVPADLERLEQSHGL
ncbi:MAG: molybdenum cofactor guanylyltransferase [Sphingomonadales bacterium]